MLISEEWFGALFTCTFAGVGCAVLWYSRLPNRLKQLLCAAIALRVLGSQLYYIVFSWSSYGGGDYLLYFMRGRAYAERMAQGDFAMFVDPAEWYGSWTGTQFVFFPTGLLFSLIGPSLRGAFVAFALLSLIGLVGFAVAFHRSSGRGARDLYLKWLLLFPSLWFWPATLGKDALLLLGLGLAVWGGVGKRGRIQWILLGSGVFLVYAIRPQVAAVVTLSLVIGQVLGRARVQRRREYRIAQNVVIAVAGFFFLRVALRSIGAEGYDAAGIQGYISSRALDTAAAGGTTVQTGSGIAGAVMGFVNVLFRPFPWEASNLTGLLAGLEIWTFWVMLYLRRHVALRTLSQFRSNRLVAIGIPFVLLYASAMGMAVANVGIIARQRIAVFPFLFLLLSGVGKEEACRGQEGSRAPTRVRPQTASRTPVRVGGGSPKS